MNSLSEHLRQLIDPETERLLRTNPAAARKRLKAKTAELAPKPIEPRALPTLTHDALTNAHQSKQSPSTPSLGRREGTFEERILESQSEMVLRAVQKHIGRTLTETDLQLIQIENVAPSAKNDAFTIAYNGEYIGQLKTKVKWASGGTEHKMTLTYNVR